MSTLTIRLLLFIIVSSLGAARLSGQFAVVVSGDLPGEVRWTQERLYWGDAIAALRTQIQQTDELIRLTGAPARGSGRVVAAPQSVMQPALEALALESRQSTLAEARERFHLSSVAVPTYREENKVHAQFSAFGETRQREQRRYAHFGQQEAMYARHKQAAERMEKLERHELEVQRKALEDLRRASTHAEMALVQGVLAASQQRVQMGQAKLAQAAGELEAFRGQLAFEEQRKAEADREWTEAVIERMREKALSGYRAQMGGSP